MTNQFLHYKYSTNKLLGKVSEPFIILIFYILLSASFNVFGESVNQYITGSKNTFIGESNAPITINNYIGSNINDSKGKDDLRPGEFFIDKFKDGGLGPEMVVIPAGSFVMGSAEGRNYELPQHTVTFKKSFAIGRHEVTLKEFKLFIKETGYWTDAAKGKGCNYFRIGLENDKQKSWDFLGFKQTDDHPVVCVSWNDAKAYLDWLSKKTGKLYRLPSEGEWEYTVRAGSKSKWYWGNDLSQACRYVNMAQEIAIPSSSGFDALIKCNGSDLYTAPVGKYLENQFKVKDMVGNASELVEDLSHKNYVGAPNDGSAWTWDGDYYKRIVRGGSWYEQPLNEGRSAYRDWIDQDASFDMVGFRVARDI